MLIRRLMAASAVLTFASPAGAATEPTFVGTFDAWTAFTYKAKDTRVCYIYAEPVKSEAARKVRRDPAYFMVTHYPGRKVKGEVSTIIGYPFKENAPVTVTVDTHAFTLFADGDTAWADGQATEQTIVAAMRSGKSLIVVGVSSKGTETKDTYSLAGVSSAMDKIDSICK